MWKLSYLRYSSLRLNPVSPALASPSPVQLYQDMTEEQEGCIRDMD